LTFAAKHHTHGISRAKNLHLFSDGFLRMFRFGNRSRTVRIRAIRNAKLRDLAQSLGAVALVTIVVVTRAEAQDRENCLYCHQFPGLSRFDSESGRLRLFYVDPSYINHSLGPRARLACTDCHEREAVSVVPHRTVSPVDCSRECHLSRPNSPPRLFSHEAVVRMLDQSVHSSRALQKLEFAGGPLLATGQSLCLYCHDEPVFSTDFRRAHLGEMSTGRCDVCHATSLPVDTPFFLRHVMGRLQSARPTLELAQVCAVCHSDPQFRAARAGDDPVASWVRSFHGKAALLGDQSTANCIDCHVRTDQNVHLMLGPAEPASAVHAARLADSCRSTECHPGADKSIAATAVHLDLPTARGTVDYLIAAAFILLTIVSFGPSALIVLLELAQLVLGRHWHGSAALRELAERVATHPDGRRRLLRFTWLQKVQHWILGLLFVLLALTGFPMKFAEAAWAAETIRLMGGLSIARALHHWAGLALIIGFCAHLAHVGWGVAQRASARGDGGRAIGIWKTLLSLPMVLQPADLRRMGQLFAYLLGLRRQRPTFGRFSAAEKFEYIGVLWGTTLLGLTGLILWGEQITSHFLGGRAFNIASIIHTYEAFLAMIHVGVLHTYNVMLAPAVFPLSLAMVSGRTPAAKLAEENGEFVLLAARDLNIPVSEAEAALEAQRV
jgi:cytochrome b subunit of formate dehydrogenase